MLAFANREPQSTSRSALDDITIGEMLDGLSRHPAKPLVFSYAGSSIRPGYHVTEVKAGQFASLDCGANPESWSEIFIQLLDVDDGGHAHMPAGKFAAIIGKVTERMALDPGARLTFEISDGVGPMQLHRASLPVALDGEIRVLLSPRPATCKPRELAFEEQSRSEAAGCCGSWSEPCCQ
jgi:hypothetical protein